VGSHKECLAMGRAQYRHPLPASGRAEKYMDGYETTRLDEGESRHRRPIGWILTRFPIPVPLRKGNPAPAVELHDGGPLVRLCELGVCRSKSSGPTSRGFWASVVSLIRVGHGDQASGVDLQMLPRARDPASTDPCQTSVPTGAINRQPSQALPGQPR
jgi:hypothetical protein